MGLLVREEGRETHKSKRPNVSFLITIYCYRLSLDSNIKIISHNVIQSVINFMKRNFMLII
jgi:hypothetical protein